jgi:hypothetical protein
MTKRIPASPPVIPGYTPVRLLGSGGYADVFLYEQQMPAREVAIKVLITDAVSGDTQRRQFHAEANLMAKVSAHPYIVQVFGADLAGDGRPFIVMEYYPGSSYLERARSERMPVAEVLRTGVQLSSAVETAHRAKILHRDIKPANILTSEYGRPGLTDFGIAAPDDIDHDDTAEGLSIPWAPPEAFGATRLDERADIYSLAATVYHLLAGRSPFEIPGTPTASLELMNRIERQPVPRIGRPDVPASLEQILAQAMSKVPAQRPASAAEFGRLLQSVESELRLAVTPLELAGEHKVVRALDDLSDEATRIRGVTTIDAQAPASTPAAALIDAVPHQPAAVCAPPPARRREGLLVAPAVPDTVLRPPAPAAPPTESSGRRTVVPLIVSGVAVVLLLVIGAAVVLGRGGSDGQAETTVPIVPNDGLDLAVDVGTIGAVIDLVGRATDGSFVFTWSSPVDAPTDVRYQVVEQASGDVPSLVGRPQVERTYASTSPCIEVTALTGTAASTAVVECASEVGG